MTISTVQFAITLVVIVFALMTTLFPESIICGSKLWGDVHQLGCTLLDSTRPLCRAVSDAGLWRCSRGALNHC